MLTTGQIKLYYPSTWPAINDATGSIGGGVGSVLVNGTNTGLFPTGQSGLAGTTSYIRYAKIFFKHEGDTADTLTNPQIYITNATMQGHISIAPDPAWMGTHSAQTGVATNRATLPNGLVSGDFTGYTVLQPMDLSAISGGTVVFSTGQTIGIWVRERIPGGIGSSYTNSFNLAIKGTIG
jgi:hypothetical protein